METFEHSKALRAKYRRRETMRTLKIVGLSLLAGGFVFFLNGGMESPIISCFGAVAIGGSAAAVAHWSWD